MVDVGDDRDVAQIVSRGWEIAAGHRLKVLVLARGAGLQGFSRVEQPLLRMLDLRSSNRSAVLDLALGAQQDEAGIVGVNGEDDGVVSTERADDLGADERLGIFEGNRNGRLAVAATAEREGEERGGPACARVRLDGRHARDDEVQLLDLLGRLHPPVVPGRVVS